VCVCVCVCHLCINPQYVHVNEAFTDNINAAEQLLNVFSKLIRSHL